MMWCEKCSIMFDKEYIIYEISNDDTYNPIGHRLTHCPYCNSKLEEVNENARL